MKYKVGDIIFFNNFYEIVEDNVATIKEIICDYNDIPCYKFNFFNDDIPNIINCDYVENHSELNIKSTRKEKLKKLNEI